MGLQGGLVVRSLLALVAVALPVVAQEQAPWAWVRGTLEHEGEQAQYVEFAARMHGIYQGRWQLRGALVAEGELPVERPERLVLIGPLGAFRRREWMPDVLEGLDGLAVRLAGVELRQRRTGIFLRNAEQTQLLYGGLSLDGFRDIFGVPTGRRDCTVTIDGKVRFEGDWVGERLVLEPRPFLKRYPTDEELLGEPALDESVVLREVYREGVRGELTAELRARLASLVEDQRVLFVGESHWNEGVNRLFQEVLEELLKNGGVRTVFLEMSESYSGYYNHYVQAEDEGEAREFMRRELHQRVNVPSLMDLLRMIRSWNVEHPEARVEVACHDMEWRAEMVARDSLAPFFAGVEPGFDVSDPFVSTDLQRMRELLGAAQEREHVGEYPFQTAEWAERVLTNLEDTMALGEDEHKMDRRQRAMVRNMVEFHGDALERGLAVFKVGRFHADREAPGVDGVYREAAYLEQVHAATKGKVVSLGLSGVGYSFDAAAGVDWGKRQASATRYHAFVKEFVKALARGYGSEGEWYLLSGGALVGVERIVAAEGARRGRNVMWLVGGGEGEYDERLFVLRSGLEVTRGVEWGQGE